MASSGAGVSGTGRRRFTRWRYRATVASLPALGVGTARWAFYVQSIDYEVYLPPTAA
jgi:hypothetical protein